jgi:hypothetical protein
MRGSRSPQCRSMSSHGLKREGRSNTAPIAMTHEFRTTPRIRHMMIVMMGDRARTSSTSDVQAYHTPRPRHGNSPEPRRFAGDGASARPTRALRVRRCRCLPRCAHRSRPRPCAPIAHHPERRRDMPARSTIPVRTGRARPIGNTTASSSDRCWHGQGCIACSSAPKRADLVENGAKRRQTVRNGPIPDPVPAASRRLRDQADRTTAHTETKLS